MNGYETEDIEFEDSDVGEIITTGAEAADSLLEGVGNVLCDGLETIEDLLDFGEYEWA